MVGKLGCWPHPGELQQLRRVDWAAAEQHLAPRTRDMITIPATVANSNRATALEKDACREGMRAHGEVTSLHSGTKVSVSGAAAAATPHCHVHTPDAFLLKAIHVSRHRISGLAAGLQPGLVQRIGQETMLGRELAVTASIVIRAAGSTFSTLEVRQNMSIAPTRSALRLPVLEIHRIASHIHQAVDG